MYIVNERNKEMKVLSQHMKDIRSLAQDFSIEAQIQGQNLNKVTDNMD